jgi:dienelactone hydrolase
LTEIRIESALIEQTPCLIFSGDSLEPAPLVFFVHGFESDKRQGIPMGYELARKGFICVSIDTILRGERVGQDFDPDAGPDFQPVYPEETYLDGFITMLKMIRQTEIDIQTLIDYFKVDPRVDAERIGQVGYSMGGWSVFYSSAVNPHIKAAVSIAGTPCFKQRWRDVLLECSTNSEWAPDLEKLVAETNLRTAFIEDMDPYSTLIEKFPTPLLMICGDMDTVAHKKYAIDLYRQIKENHNPKTDHLILSVYDGIGHQLELAMAEETADWINEVFSK